MAPAAERAGGDPVKTYYSREPDIPHVIPPLIPGAPRGASASIRCDNGAVYDRFENADDGPLQSRRWRWERREGCGPRETWGSPVAVQESLL